MAASDLEQDAFQSNRTGYHEAWRKLCECQGVLVPGGFGARGVEGKVAAAHWARTNRKPFLGVCLGMQCAVIEFARNELGHEDAHSTEFNPESAFPVVIDMPEHNPGDMGATMRLGRRRTIFKTRDSILRKLYGDVVGDIFFYIGFARRNPPSPVMFRTSWRRGTATGTR